MFTSLALLTTSVAATGDYNVQYLEPQEWNHGPGSDDCRNVYKKNNTRCSWYDDNLVTVEKITLTAPNGSGSFDDGFEFYDQITGEKTIKVNEGLKITPGRTQLYLYVRMNEEDFYTSNWLCTCEFPISAKDICDGTTIYIQTAAMPFRLTIGKIEIEKIRAKDGTCVLENVCSTDIRPLSMTLTNKNILYGMGNGLKKFDIYRMVSEVYGFIDGKHEERKLWVEITDVEANTAHTNAPPHVEPNTAHTTAPPTTTLTV